ncbi:Fe(3+)-hydroxamate ABC transporter permease FhuB [Starkeya sp. 3C]|uniref:Fe(3+)-hydroxamate ABC transporter permease FhuB n=1 Tax=Ancylobacter moscoviensis TaxID=2597768 RepID=A0ABY3DP38_9HYPH|nr:Fe(3+)-hydroxamate ABC transporter permease FhuB [Ancylobacter moscoviensis]TSJ61345.1 Fe(3+)-hydroxamate ABC transporter permease FhuB [Ancylobacter moscoviensis]
MADTVADLRFSRLWGGAALLALCAAVAAVLTRPGVPGLDDVVLWQVALPRGAVALLAGGALGLSGALLQRVLRNPIADPSTLGIAAGAQLALTLVLAFAPGLAVAGRETIALAGGAGAAVLVLALGWRRGLDPVTVVLSGMMIALVAGAVSATLVLARGEYVLSLYIWGAGSLAQQGWGSVATIGSRLVLGLAATALLARPLALLGLDDAGARSLGLGLAGARLAAMTVAVWLAATVTAEVGVIGFVGLAAPAFARLAGAGTSRQIMTLAPITGALVLSLADSFVQLAGTDGHDLAPTGAATALLGGPLLLWLLPRVHSVDRLRHRTAAAARRLRRPAWALAGIAGVVLLVALGALTIGRAANGWHVAGGELFAELLPFRAPRLVAAGGAGMMLAAAGLVMQRMTGNPMASPEVLGVSAGGGVGLAVLLFAGAATGPLVLVGMGAGSLAVLLVMLAVAARWGFGPERLLLAGIACGALCMAVISTVLASGGMTAYMLLVWMSGSTNRVGPFEAWTAVGAALVLVAPLFLLARWMTVLPLGATASRSLGMPVRRARLVLAVLAALLTAAASFVVGPLSLVGLMAPHLARLMGFVRLREQLAAALLLGALLLILADWLARLVVFPYQVPTGLFAALIGGPYLIWLLHRGGTQRD